MTARHSFDAVILAGGSSRRLGGADKVSITIGGSTLLERALTAVAAASRIVCVGPARPAAAPVLWTQEEPAAGGPLAALGAGLALVDAPVVVVLGVDTPFVSASVVAALVKASVGRDAALVVDEYDVAQPLIGAYDTGCLRTRVGALGDLSGMAMRHLIEGISYERVVDPRAARDCDTWADIELARKAEGA